MASKLTDITASYNLFKKDQVLTHNQLNTFLDYFDDQHRLSRVLLSGVGNVCGFNVDNGTDSQLIYISQGCGVTTDGDLLTLRIPGTGDGLKNIDIPGITYTNYKEFKDEKASYPAFIRNGSKLPMWELLTTDEATTDGLTQPLIRDFPGLGDMVVLLYLESYEDEADLCEGLSCDAQGIHLVSRLRVLLLSQQDADFVLSGDSLFTKHDLMATYMQLKDLTVKRVLVTSSNSDTIASLVTSYNISNESVLIKDLKDGLAVMKKKLDPYFPNNPIKTILLSLEAKLPVNTPSRSLYFQYRYDLLRDVVDSYNELKEQFIHISTACFPSITAFPKHLFIGKLHPTEEDVTMKRYRHDFYRSPILNDTPEYDTFTATLQRLDEQLRAYPQLPETSTNGQLFESQIKFNNQLLAEKDLRIKRGQGLYRSEIKITPSQYRTALGNKAIPFYYTVGLPLLKAWSNDKTLLGKYRRNLAYDTTLLDSALDIKTPLLYNLERSNFFRVEGHQGHDFKEALETINAIRDKNGLSFDTKVIGIDLDTSVDFDTTEYACEFEDLSVLLNAWVQEQECNLGSVASLVSAYSLKDPGKNLKEEVYTPRVGAGFLAQRFPEEEAAGKLALENQGSGKQGSGLSASLKVNRVLAEIDPEVSQQQKTVVEANRNFYGSSSIVLENLTTDKSAIGYAFLKAVEANVKGSASEFIAEGNFHANVVINEPDSIPWVEDMYIAIVDNTLQILSYSHVLSNSIPTSIGGITDQIIANYNTNINNLCVNLKRVQVTLTSSSTLTDKNRGILGLLVAQLTSICCASKQLQTLLVEIDKRKDAILERLTLKKFAEEHPGMEHLAGVEPGGTFVMVYLKKGLSVEGAVSNTPNGTVVADFSLPYMCCSDCAPINFIIPRAPVQLRLDTDVYCLGDQPGALFFQVEPADGVIKASREIPGMSIVGKVLTIDPALIPSSALDEIIHFTVNDQVTNTQLRIVRPINAFFEVPESPVTQTNIQFAPIGDFPAGTKFLWNFGDGTTSTERLVYHYFKLPVNDDNKVEVTLTVTPANGACPTVDKHEISFQEITISLEKEEYCVNDEGSYDFKISPEDAVATITGRGVKGKKFIPSLIGDTGPIQIYLNGNLALRVMINPLPSVLGSGYVKDNLVNLTGTVTSEDEFTWRFLDADEKEEIHPKVTNKLSPIVPLEEFKQDYVQPGAVFYAKLVASNPCGETDYTIRLTVPANTEYCNASAKGSIDKLRDKLKNAMQVPGYSKLTAEQKDMYNKSAEYLTKIMEGDVSIYLDGSQNGSVVSFTATMLGRIREAIMATTTKTISQRDQLIRLYDWISESFFAIIQCQNENNFRTSAIASMMDIIKAHLDPHVQTSFAVKLIDIDPNREYAMFLEDLLEFRADGTTSYSFVKKVLDYLSYYGGTINDPAPAPAEDR